MFNQFISNLRENIQRYKCKHGIHNYGEYILERYDPSRDTALFYSYCKCKKHRIVIMYNVTRKIGIPRFSDDFLIADLYEVLKSYEMQLQQTKPDIYNCKIIR